MQPDASIFATKPKGQISVLKSYYMYIHWLFSGKKTFVFEHRESLSSKLPRLVVIV